MRLVNSFSLNVQRNCDQIQHIEVVMEQQKMTMNDQVDRDVFGYSYNKGWMCIQVFL